MVAHRLLIGIVSVAVAVPLMAQSKARTVIRWRSGKRLGIVQT